MFRDLNNMMSKVLGRLQQLVEEKDHLLKRNQSKHAAEVESLNKSLAHLTTHDALTDLPNRSLLEDRLTQLIEFARADNTVVCVMCLSICDFRNINNTYGHHVGDALTVMVAERLVGLVPKTITIARIGGNKFGIIESIADGKQEIENRVHSLIAGFTEQFSLNGVALNIAINLGVSIFPDDGVQASELVKHADLAMYRARSLGHNRHQFFTADMDVEVEKQHRIINDLRQAIKADQLCVYYQPQFSLATNEMVGAEALVRWQHPQLGMISPDDFIHLAEQSGCIHEVSAWVMYHILPQVKLWHEQFQQDWHVAINISVAEFRRPDFVDSIKAIVQNIGFDVARMDVEITEGAMLVSPAMEALHQLGVNFCIDDFGKGYSSMSRLNSMPLHKIKIDMSFIKNLFVKEENQVIVKAIINLGHNLGLLVLAEGVETQEQFDFLRDAGCDQVQGYLLSKPLASKDFARFLIQQSG